MENVAWLVKFVRVKAEQTSAIASIVTVAAPSLYRSVPLPHSPCVLLRAGCAAPAPASSGTGENYPLPAHTCDHLHLPFVCVVLSNSGQASDACVFFVAVFFS